MDAIYKICLPNVIYKNGADITCVMPDIYKDSDTYIMYILLQCTQHKLCIIWVIIKKI